jgi:hypothetical protein
MVTVMMGINWNDVTEPEGHLGQPKAKQGQKHLPQRVLRECSPTHICPRQVRE